MRSKRSFDTSEVFSHVVGYTGYNQSQHIDPRDRADERVGISGLEKEFNDILDGKDGREVVEISALGVIQRSIMITDPAVDGKDLTISVDRELSNIAYEAIAPHPGAVVVTDIPTGQILTLVSSPSYKNASLSAALKDASKPLLNRALTSYPPGSTFKLMTALSALRAGKIKQDTQIDDEGEIKAGEQIFGNWYWRQYGKKEGKINLVRAIARSNDIYFYKIAESVGPDLIDQMAQEFGLGKSTGIELPSESMGLLPNSAWKEKKVGEKWYLGDTYNMGIGQGYILATPIQVNNMTATVARRGSWCPLTLMLTKDPACTDIELSHDDIETVITGMVDACSSGGTAFPFFPINEKLPTDGKIACKTGTAEFGGEDEKGRKKTHGWFTMFYPVKKPQVAITVFLESTKDRPFLEGSKDGAPIAVKVFEKWREKYE
jgi:penicillin-binding protein 2